MVVVMNKQLQGSVELPQPNGTNAIYLQSGNCFKLIPQNIPILTATIRLFPTRLSLDPTRKTRLTDCTEYELTREDGGTYGGTAFVWDTTVSASATPSSKVLTNGK
jgi:hypothetical protein